MFARHSGLLAVCLVCLVGCAGSRDQLHKALLATNHPSLSRDLEAHYAIRCPDVLDIHVEGRPDLSGRYAVGHDSQITLVAGHSLHVAGRTAPRIAALLAQELHLPESAIRVRVSEYNSQHLYLVGEVEASRQVISYRGPETVVDLLRRVEVGSKVALSDVRVVRAHVADGKPPEVFHVDLTAVLLRRDAASNIRLEPSDHIHIGQRRPSKVAGCIPPWFRPIYESFFGMK